MSAKELKRPLRLLLATFFITLIALAGTPSKNPDFVDALWVAESGRVLKIARADGTVLFEIPDARAITSLAIDPSHATLWAYGHGSLYAYDFAGQRRLAAPLSSAGDEDEDDDENTEVGLAVDPKDGSVWLGRHKHLYHVDGQGQVLTTTLLDKTIQGLSIDPSRGHAWIATRKHLSAYDALGKRVQHLTPAGSRHLSDIAYDPSLDALWVADHHNRIGRYGAEDGALQLEAKVPKHPETLAPDHNNGLWISADEELIKLDAEGHEVLRLEPFSGEEKKLIAIVADPVAGGVWVAAKRAIRYVEADGQTRPSLALTHAKQKRKIRALALYTDSLPPRLSFSSPAGGSFLAINQPTFELHYEDSGIGVDPATLAITENGQPLPVTCTYEADRADCTPTTPLAEGTHSLQAEIADFNGNRSDLASVAFTVDTIPPEITLDIQSSEVVTNQADFTLAGHLSEPTSLSLDDAPLAVDAALHFSQVVVLVEGLNTYTFTATDAAGHTGTATARVTLDTVPPAAPDETQIQVTAPGAGRVSVTGAAGSVEPNAVLIITNTRTGESVTVTANSDGSFTAQIGAEAGDLLEIRVTDAAGNQSETRSLPVGGSSGGLPPDPATVAPPLSETAITPLADATAFLYSGANPIQTGVAEGTIEPRRAAIVRGRVLNRDNQALPGVTMTVKDHPELGQTLSRADGAFDMAVNGGGLLTIHYEKPGYLPAQRQVHTPWQDYAIADDVVMVALDPQVTPIDLSSNAAIQVAQGSVITDQDGTRQATVFFPAGTGATMTLADGTTQSLTALDVRATEYTVGDNGPKAMPGPLPTSSGYTYAVELSVDAALAAGATRVDFDQALPFYVDNFLNFPVGGIVPVGWYDKSKSAWIPSDNGRVIKILSTTGGAASLDTDGDTLVDDTAKLTTLGITDAELAQLAGLYPAGKTLWRSPITHFTPWDCNWPFGPPPGADGPNGEPPNGDNPPDSDNSDDCKGCSIEAQSQTLGEEIPITGTAFKLHYRSDRVPGRTSANTLTIPLSGATVPSDLKEIVLKIELAGRAFEQHFAAAPDQTHSFTWDGNDAYGRPVTGSQLAKIRIGYVYQGVYFQPARFARSFAMASGSGGSANSILDNRARQEITLWRDSQVTIGRVQNPLAGWSLSAQHRYDALGGILYTGDGGKRSANNINAIITTVAGNGTAAFSGDGGPATLASLSGPADVAVAPDGSLYIAEFSNHRIRRIGPEGAITTVAGNGIRDFSGGGGPATLSSLNNPQNVAVAPDGSLYIADFSNHRIRRVGPEGVITTVAGNGIAGFSGDGGPATQARLRFPEYVAVAPDGSLYIAEFNNHRIRHISSVFENTGAGDTVTASADGLELYYFDTLGRHQRTVDAVTGVDRYRFAYDGNGNLVTVTDRDGDLTRIERDATGDPIAIVAPDGERTALALNAEGYLASVSNPAGDTYRLDYSAGGLLKTFTDPKGHSDNFLYDTTGLLVRNTNAGQGGWTLARTVQGQATTVSMTTAEGRTSSFQVEPLATGDRRQVNTSPDGTVQTKLFKTNGEETATAPDGTVTTVLQGPDPRFGMQAPVPGTVSVRLPSGLTSSITTTRMAALSDPADPLSLTRLTETTTVNGKAYSSTFDKATRTYTHTSPTGRVSTTVINDHHRPLMRQRIGLNSVNHTYDPRGRLTEITTGARTTHLGYYESGASQGYLHTLTDVLDRTVSYDYDLAGRVTRQTLPDGRAIELGYDANGNLTSLTPPGQPAHLFDYTALDQEKDYTPPAVDTFDPATHYTYNRDKDLELLTKGKIIKTYCPNNTLAR